jgi:hypothetical protein
MTKYGCTKQKQKEERNRPMILSSNLFNYMNMDTQSVLET